MQMDGKREGTDWCRGKKKCNHDIFYEKNSIFNEKQQEVNESSKEEMKRKENCPSIYELLIVPWLEEGFQAHNLS